MSNVTDAVIVDAIRTPIGSLGGALAPVRPDDLAALVIREIDPAQQAGSESRRGSLFRMRQSGGRG